MNLKPLGDRLIVEPIEQEEMTASGIVLPETAKEKPMQGKVLTTGPGARKEDGSRIVMDVSTGDTILYTNEPGNGVPRSEKVRGGDLRPPGRCGAASGNRTRVFSLGS